MAIFVHLAPESRAKLIQRNGINRLRRGTDRSPGGVFAVPVTRSFYLSHQWLRELKRRGQRTIAGVYFRVADDEDVWVGHYRTKHEQMTAAEAVAEFMAAENREGWEVVIGRRIASSEIVRVRLISQVIGWRYYPEAKGKRPFCGCRFCTRGEYGAKRLRQRLGTAEP
jgi:hypothetical protein